MKIEPSKQFPHSENAVTALSKYYDLEVCSYAEASAGIENTTLIVKCTVGTYVFRVSRHGKKSDEHIQAELDFMAYLGVNGIPVPKIIPNNQGRSITLLSVSTATWQVIVMDYVKGEHAAKPSTKLLRTMAHTQARMHLMAAGYHRSGNAIRVIKQLVETEFITLIDQSVLHDELRRFLQRGADYTIDLDERLPTGPCHLDYDEMNILCVGDSIAAILDFDDLSIIPYVVCLAYTLWHVYDRSGEVALMTYLADYQQLRPLSRDEKQMLYKAILFRHYMISAIKILDGQTTADDIEDYVTTEQFFMTASSY